jgi:hypothetical protein
MCPEVGREGGWGEGSLEVKFFCTSVSCKIFLGAPCGRPRAPRLKFRGHFGPSPRLEPLDSQLQDEFYRVSEVEAPRVRLSESRNPRLAPHPIKFARVI